jgi:hypothetical protein
MQKPEFNMERLVRSAIAGSAGEPYCAMIIEAAGKQDGNQAFPTVESIDRFWEEAANSELTVAQFILANKE